MMNVICKCENCGQEFEGRQRMKRGEIKTSRFCSVECRREAEHPDARVCKHCGKEFRPANWHKHDFCSRECAGAYIREQTAARKEQERKERESLPKPTGTCEWCGAEFVKACACQKFCSPECRYKAELKKGREEYIPKPAKTKTCKTCGIEFETARDRQVFCSEACAKRMERRKERARGYRAHRSVNHYLRHYPEVFARDGGYCQLCGLPIVPDAEQIWHGSLDHIIPQSAGGPDEVWNLRLVHVICNAIRQNDETMHMIKRERLARYQGPFTSLRRRF